MGGKGPRTRSLKIPRKSWCCVPNQSRAGHENRRFTYSENIPSGERRLARRPRRLAAKYPQWYPAFSASHPSRRLARVQIASRPTRVASIKKDTEVKNNFGIEGRGARV